MKEAILQAARAHMIPAGSRGVWYVNKLNLGKNVIANKGGKLVEIPAGRYTQLWRLTERSINNSMPGEIVMQDTPDELKTHTEFMLKAHGRVLVSGLGLGCVARGCLANPEVTKVTVIEKSRAVLWLVRRHMPRDPRLEIIRADALEWAKETRRKFDCCWHDLWSDEEAGEPHLAVLHSKLLLAMARKSAMQGAWSFPREAKRLWARHITIVG